MDDRVVEFVDEGIGHTSHLVDLGDGTAIVIDPRRIPEAERAEAASRGLRIAFTADTHSHADFVSGSPELAATGAEFLAPAAGDLAVPHRGLRDGDRVGIGSLVLEAIATPGHTPDHLAYLIETSDGSAVGLFSGGSLMVGTVGRTDLLGERRADELARAQFHTLRHRILALPDDLAVYPTHGAGSFCSAPGASERATTIGHERASNPLLQIDDEDRFVDALAAGFGSFPPYFRRLPAVNRLGPRLYGRVPELARRTVDEVRGAIGAGALLVDARPIADFATAHVPGSVSIELRPAFATWVGWLAEASQPVVFVLADGQDRHELVRQCLTVGVETLVGEIDGGIGAWLDAGLPVASLPLVPSTELGRRTVLDVRQRDEFTAGHVPGSRNVELGRVDRAEVPAGPVAVVCGHGERAMTGASILQRAGHRDLVVLAGGPGDWRATTGRALAVGP